uniref:Uncharacterized protein LOC104230180 n=1 Tax=Nicotiana sylvestris TaxID=4096 RepID=A0A1U7WMP5_NICSY
MPPSSCTPYPSYHVSQNGGSASVAPSSPPSSSTPSVSRPHNQTFEEIVSYDSFHRLIIILDGTTGFVPSNESMKVVVDCVKGFYRDAWNKCAWIPKYHQQISHNFEKKAADRLKNLLYKARQKGEKPGWMLKAMWDRLIMIWASEEFKKRSNAAKAARASNTGGSLHTGGSISMETHRRRMEKEKGRVMTYAE